MNIFLTGGTGFIGKALTPRLLARGWRVTALVRNPRSPQAGALQSLGVQCVQGDITERASMRVGMRGADTVIHNAGHYEFGLDATGRQKMRAINVTGTENVLSLALELRVPRCLYVSTALVWGNTGPQLRDETFARQADNFTFYEQTKTEAHHLATQYQQRGLPLMIVCPNGVIGPNDHSVWGYFLRLYLNKLIPPYAWIPDGIITLVDVDDVADGLALATEKGRLHETYILSGESKTRREHIDYWAIRTQRQPIRLWLPAWLAAASCAPLEPLQRRVGLPAFISRESVRASIPHFNYSSAKAQRELGWQPRSAEEMWFKAIDRELELLGTRKNHSVVARLKPIDRIKIGV